MRCFLHVFLRLDTQGTLQTGGADPVNSRHCGGSDSEPLGMTMIMIASS